MILNKLKAKTTLIFDMGDLLYDASVWRRWLYNYLTSKKLITISFEKMIGIWEERFLSKIHTNKISYKDGFKEFLLFLGLSDNDIAILWDLNWNTKKEIESNISPFPLVKETLSELKKRGFKIVVLTDTELKEQEIRNGILKRLNLQEEIDIIVSSFDIHFRKPDPEAFDFCLKKANSSKNKAIFIAHDEDELTGARKQKLTTVAYNYIEPIEADYKIKSFDELLTIEFDK